MGRRFPEFSILRAACLVSAKASSSTTGDARVASYRAAIDSVAARHYSDWPFMVEVLNKWLEINRDFIRDPLGHNASPPTPPSAHPATSTIRDTPDHVLTPALTSDGALTQTPFITLDRPSSSPPSEAEIPECNPDSPPVNSTSGTEPGDLDDPPSPPSDRRDLRVPIINFFPFTWTISFRFLPSLWNLVVDTLSSVVPSSLARFKQNQGRR